MAAAARRVLLRLPADDDRVSAGTMGTPVLAALPARRGVGAGMSLVDLERLARIVEEQRTAFAAATPFPHLVIDDLVDPE